jgi:hypothetical protein
MLNNQNINDTISKAIKCAESIIDDMPVGSRLTTKEIVSKIVFGTDIPVSVATGMTALIVSNCNRLKMRAGRNGGAYKLAESMVMIKDSIVDDEVAIDSGDLE